MSELNMSRQIKEIRKRYGLSQQAFARLLGIGEASITRYESGIAPTNANANLIRAAMIPEFMAGCLERDGDALTPKQRASVEKIVYAEITFDEEGEIMDMTDIYELTLQQEVLNEKAAEIRGDIINGLIEAEEPQHGPTETALSPWSTTTSSNRWPDSFPLFSPRRAGTETP